MFKGTKHKLVDDKQQHTDQLFRLYRWHLSSRPLYALGDTKSGRVFQPPVAFHAGRRRPLARPERQRFMRPPKGFAIRADS